MAFSPDLEPTPGARPRSLAGSVGIHRIFAVVAAVLMVTSVMVAPVLASPPSSPDPGTVGEAGESNPSYAIGGGTIAGTGNGDGDDLDLGALGGDPDDVVVQQTVFAARSAPRALLDDARAASPPTNDAEAHRVEALAAFDGSIEGYASPIDPAERATVTNASAAVRSLAETVATERGNESSAAHLARIRNASARATEAGRIPSDRQPG